VQSIAANLSVVNPPEEDSRKMADDESNRTDRRTFLQAGALATALGAAQGTSGQESALKSSELPRRPLGKTGIEITILDQGTGKGPDVDRLLRFGFARGVRAFDTSETYHSEAAFKRWFQQDPGVRTQIFLVSKDAPKAPSQLMGMLDRRCAALGTDYVDLLFIHSFGDYHKLDDAITMVKSRELKEAADAAKKSGKARLVGISTHHKDRAQLIQAAAEGGIVDVIMLQYRPWLDNDSPLNKAIDAAHKRGIGLISMKQIAGNYLGDKPKGNILKEVVRRVPVLTERKLTPFQGLLHAIWTDERLSAVCTTMRNTDHIRENTDAARRFEPLKQADIHQLRDATLAHGSMLCADCDGRCSIAAGTHAELGNLTRFLTYFEHHGLRGEARRLYAALPPEAREWAGADLEAATAACPNRLDFARLLPLVDRRLV
jgi:aryl-alcohol dehydrogenase-like predicted oxidoreductase